ncbi:hypothetical protein Lser_V15G42497 [Lactuca serriola]
MEGKHLNLNVGGEGFEPDDMFEDAPLDFDPAYPPLYRWKGNHPKEQVLGDPQAGVLTRAQLCAKNEKVGDYLMLVQIYVDDIIFGSTDPSFSSEFEHMMKNQFKMSMMGKINNFLGLNIRQSKDGIFINPEKYSRNLLEKFGLMNSSKLLAPMAVGTRLGPLLDKNVVDITLYMSMIGLLLYLTANRHDIIFVVCNCVVYQSNPRVPHLTGVKNTFRYLKGTVLFGLWYPSKTRFSIQVFSDADLGGCHHY